MLSDKEIKKRFKEEASAQPDTYYATDVLRSEGFERKQCVHCKTYFWTVNSQQTRCGDSSCQGGFSFHNNNPASNTLSYSDVWKQFSQQFSQHGYVAIDRFPVVARWNPTMDFTIASIAAFQPFVVSGEAQPPAPKLTIPQFCLRFGDIANVGVTMSHMTGFVMIGQHQFVPRENWNQDTAFREILLWLTQGLGLPKNEITFHEDAWAGGGNFGPCMEFFSRGVELGNQVYMLYEQTPTDKGRKELDLKVLDMGMGMERNAWFSQATPTIYDATFPQTIQKLVERTGVEFDKEFIAQYVPHGANLNVDEVEDIGEAWNWVAQQMGVDVDVLKKKLHPMTAIYSIAEHARSLLFALADGALPSNVGGGYNLRVILRRALGFIKEYNWPVTLYDVCAWHAQELRDIFPELTTALPDVKKIITAETHKYNEARKRNKQFIAQVLAKGTPTTQDLVSYYDSRGISPEEFVQAQQNYIKEEQEKNSESSSTDPDLIKIPDNFYSLVAARHQQKQSATTTSATRVEGFDTSLTPTKPLYYDDWKIVTFQATILQVLPTKTSSALYVVLDQTAFYPTSGGQIHDKGTIQLSGDPSCQGDVIDCFKQGSLIVHVVTCDSFKSGDTITGHIDFSRREQLTQHHSATHIINGAAREILGNHIWQAGASKNLRKARLDITHFQSLSSHELCAIEQRSNEIVKENIPITKQILPRAQAQQKYGFRLYQGGAVPGEEIRVVSIPGVDTEACGGTHLNSTDEAKKISILKSSKLQDGVVRLEFVAGEVALQQDKRQQEQIVHLTKLLACQVNEIPGRCKELFVKWKKAKKKKLPLEDFALTSTQQSDGDVLQEAADYLKTQPEHLVKTVKKFLLQLEQFKEKLRGAL